MTTPRHALGIDLGTSGVRAQVIDEAGRLQAEARVAAPLTPEPAAWWSAVTRVLEELGAAGQLAQVGALAVDGTSGSVCLADETGRPLGPARLYHQRPAEATWARLRAAAGGPVEAGALGHALELAAAHGGGRLHSQADWIARRLGAPPHCDENNALKLGYDPVARRWPPWVERLGEAAGLGLPPVHPPGTPVGRVAPDLCRRFRLPAACRIAAGTTDSIAATLAAGADAPGDAVTTLGSTLVLKLVSERPVWDADHGVYSHRLWDRWLVGGASNAGGAVLARHFDADTLARLSRRIDPNRPSGLDYYPLPAPGERFPIADPQLPPRLTPRPADDVRFLHGLLEGLARIEAQGYRLLARLTGRYPRRVLSCGGGAANPTWTALRQRLLGVPVHTAPHTEAAYGSALLARRALDERTAP